jgi:predicted dehydrogenase
MNPLQLIPKGGVTAEPFGVAVVGCGYWGMNYVRVLDELAETQVLAVCDQRPDRLQELARRLPEAHLTTSSEDAIHQDGVQAVIVCTEASTHYELVRRCLLEGKHVLVEKPIATVGDEAKELATLADSSSRVLMVGHTFLYNAGIRKVKECLDRGSQRVYYLHACRTNLGPIRRDVNALWDLATHDIAIFNYLLNATPEWVSAVGVKVLRNYREDVAFLSLGYAGDIVGHIHVSWADPNKAREIVVVCNDKRIVFNDLNGLEQVRVFEKAVRRFPDELDEPLSYGEYTLQIRDGDILSPKIEIREPLKEQCRHFVECVREGLLPLTSGWDGLDVVRVLEAADRSIQAKGVQTGVIRDASDRSYQRSA